MRGYLIAAVAGFVVGVLCAPKKGAVLRKEIKDGFRRLQENGEETLDEMQRKSREIVDMATPAISEANDKVRYLQREGTEVLRIASAHLREAYRKSQPSLQKAHEKIIEHTARSCKRLFGRAGFAAEDMGNQAQEADFSGLGLVKDPVVTEHAERREIDHDAPAKRYGRRGISLSE